MNKKSDIIEDGKPRMGLWYGDIRNVDPRAYHKNSLHKLIQPLREKRWQFVGVYTSDIILGMAIVHAGYIGNVFCYLFDRKRKSLWEVSRLAPLGAGIRIDRNVYRGVTSYHADHERVRFDSRIPEGVRTIDVRLKDKNQDLDVRLEVSDDMQLHPPLQIVTPTSGDDFTFTHKVNSLPVSGFVRLGDRRWSLQDARCAIDFSVGYPARETFWNWVSLCGKTNDGTDIGINGVAPIFHKEYNENILWLAEKPFKLSELIFDYNQENPMDPWKIYTEDRTLSLTFTPEGIRKESLNYRLVTSSFQQPFGAFEGSFTEPSGRIHELYAAGVVEEHFARW
ncbi:MAG: DUF2804 domain-containing protein [Myxococcota bacterium]|nr:DUF2804 domain-containing protein [Myxococcota bacterium]